MSGKLVVNFMHIRETWTGGEVLATKWVLGEEVNVVGDKHKVANGKIWVDTS